ncbi:MAG: glycosyltransferase [Caldilineaceae bacterium]|nr:glycosyltransferase [Caldilineaceae bacterium]
MAQKTKILLLIKSLGLGGAERLLVDSIPYWDRDRYDYAVAYLVPWKSTLAPAILAAGVPLYCLAPGRPAIAPASPMGMTPARSGPAAALLPLAAARLARLQRRERFALIHADLPVAGVVARSVGRAQAMPVAYTEHNVQERYHPITRALNRATLPWTDQVWAVSAEVAASLRRACGTRTPCLDVLPNGIPVEQLAAEAAVASGLRAELAIDPSHAVVGTLAVFRPQKRLLDWVEVAARVAARRQDVTFVLVGDGPEMPAIQARVAARGLQDRVRLPGFRADGRRYLAVMDLFLMTSEFEGMPVALLEAMGLGKAVVASAVGGVGEVVHDGVNGRLTRSGACEQSAAILCDLLAQPAERRRLGEAAAATIAAGYHIRRRVAAIEAGYARLTAGRSA